MFTNPDKIILGPIITEKALIAQQNGIYSFWVMQSATKYQIAAAFQSVFGIKPLSVRTIKVWGKTKADMKKRTPIQKPDRKKAIIVLPKDSKIESLNFNQK